MNNTETNAKKYEGAAVVQSDSSASGRAIGVTRDLDTRTDLSLRSFRNEAEIHAINYALQQTGWNRKRAARLLSISYRSLLYKIRRHNIMPAAEQS